MLMKRIRTTNFKIGIPTYVGISIFLIFILGISIILAVAFGSSQIEITDVYRVILYKVFKTNELSGYGSGPVHDVVWLIRMPRIILAVAVGGGLAVCGLVMQAVVKNPLADPYVLGVSSGASLGATVAILLGVGVSFGENFVGILAFLGAFSASLLVMAIANTGSRANPVKLLLSGMAVSAVFSAFSSFIIFAANDKEGIQTITFWLMGSLSGAKWSSIGGVYLIVLLGVLFFMSQYRTLNLMLLGDEVSITLGTDLYKSRMGYMLITALMIGFIVYVSGMIGFIGLIIPHFTRLLLGTDHKQNLPVAFLSGGVFMVWADVLSRTVIPHTELPIGILISMVGAPCFVYLLISKHYHFGGDA